MLDSKSSELCSWLFDRIYLSLQIRLNSSKLELKTASTMTISEYSVSREETSSQEVVLLNLSTKMTKLIYKQQDNISSHNKILYFQY